MRECDRGIADYSYCIDDDYTIYDADDTVCDDGNDGLTNEEAKAYENECRAEAMLKAELRRLFNYGSFWDDDTYSHPIEYQK